MGDDFKNSDTEPRTDAEQQPPIEPPADAVSSGTTPANRVPEVDSRPLIDGVFKTPSFVIRTIVENQKNATCWEHSDSIAWIRGKCVALVNELDLRVKDAEKVGTPLIKIERMNIRTLANYLPYADGYGIPGTIVLNEERFPELEPFVQLTVLLVTLFRVRNHGLGGDGRFDREAREKMQEKGLVVTQKGKIKVAEDGAFRKFLERRGIEVPAEPKLPQQERQGRTTLQQWSCTCQSCRVGTRDFIVVCPVCNEPFRPGDHIGKRLVPTGT
jgi:hypothetical protein